jgi:Flp pilus assembly protein CpaB
LKRANRLILLFGVVLAAVSFVAVLGFGSFGQQPQQPTDPDVQVVVTSTNVSLGTALTADMLTTSALPQSQATNTYGTPDDVVGMVVRRNLAQGEALKNQDFQSAVTVPDLVRAIQPGLRAMAVPLSRVDSVGMLLQPGDWVDVVLTIDERDGLNPVSIPNAGASPGVAAPYVGIDDFVNNTTVKVVVQNVQILAALHDQPTTDTANGSGSGAPGPQATSGADVIAILAVQPQEVEVIRFAQVDGRISLVLRSPSDYAAGSVTTSGITLRQLVDQYGVLPPLPVTAP